MTDEIDADVVKLAFQLLLGRTVLGNTVEEEEAIKAHVGLKTIAELRRGIMSSPEFLGQMRRLANPTTKWVSTDVLGRFTMWLDLSDPYISSKCLDDNYEPSETKFVMSRLRAGDVVLDIGANIGWFSLVAARAIGRHGMVHAFEPRSEPAAMLKRTIADNDLRDQIIVWELALSDTWERARLGWSKDSMSTGDSFVLPDGPTPDHHEFAWVRSAILDELLPDVTPDLIKIDVEGAEPRVLSGAKNAIKRKKPVIVSELLPYFLRVVSGVTAAQYIALLGELGYSCYLLEDGRPTRKLKDFPSDVSEPLVSVIFEFEGIRI
jgi:FkbM family methyltransferase